MKRITIVVKPNAFQEIGMHNHPDTLVLNLNAEVGDIPLLAKVFAENFDSVTVYIDAITPTITKPA